MSDERKRRSVLPHNAESPESRPSSSTSTIIAPHASSADFQSAHHPRVSNGQARHAPISSQPPNVLSLAQIASLMDNEIVPDEQHARDDDVDSAYGTESLIGEDTTTLASYITDYRYENGRRYHSYRDGSYWGPNDESGNEIQDLAHHMYLITLGGRLFLAPIQEPQTVLDVGTGTGIWAIEMADAFPSAEVIGTDLSPIQPDFVPPNCSFEIDDATLEWTYPENHFDFVHVRELFGSVPDWEYFCEEAYSHIKPGGWIEIVEHSVAPVSDDDTVGPDHFYTLWGKTVIESGRRFGKTFEVWKVAKRHLENAGFRNVVQVPYKWPMNGWPADPRLKEIGRWNQLRLHDGIEGFMLRLLTTALNWSYERAQLFLAEMRQNLRDLKTHAYLEGTVVYGQKPPNAVP